MSGAARRHAHTPSGQFYGQPSYTPPTVPTSAFASPPRPMSNPDSPLERFKSIASQVEELMDTYSHPVKPYLPGIGRFLIVCTFLEDAFRMTTQWSDQKYFLQRHRGFPWGFSQLFLLFNIITMLSCSVLVIGRRYPEAAVGGLLAVVVVQGFGYGLIFDLNFFLRNLSVCGGLLMFFAESLSKRKNLFAGIPSVSEDDKKTYFQLAGRVLLVFLFLGFVLNGKLTVMRALFSIVGLVACISVAVGFKAKFSALFLVVTLSIINIFMNNFWSVPSAHPQRDFLRYDFFQTLSIVGGLLLLANMGAGTYSFDGKKRL